MGEKEKKRCLIDKDNNKINKIFRIYLRPYLEHLSNTSGAEKMTETNNLNQT